MNTHTNLRAVISISIPRPMRKGRLSNLPKVTSPEEYSKDLNPGPVRDTATKLIAFLSSRSNLEKELRCLLMILA